jgi:pyruvate formate lyase activating enzyme
VNTNNAHNLKNRDAVRPIYSITPFTLLDYPDKTACILWFAGCNMRCSYCYNPDIVLGKGKLSFEDALKFLNTRKNLLDGVVLSGGECTLNPKIKSLIKEIKNIGMDVKIDTNGSRPNVLKQLINENLINYVSLDFKAVEKKYYEITKSKLFNQFKKSLTFLIQSTIPFEVRTTIHSDLITQEDIQQMLLILEDAHYSGKYYLQNYVNNTTTLGNTNNSKSKFIDLGLLHSKIQVIIRN